MASSLAELALRISATDAASPILQQVAREAEQQTRLLEASYGELAAQTRLAAAAQENAGAASGKASGAHKEHATALGRLGEAFKSVGQEALRLATFQTIWNLEGDLASKLGTAAEAFDKFGNSVAGVQRLTGESAESSSLLLGTFTRYGASAEQASTALIKLNRSIAGLEDPMDIVAAGGKSGAKQLELLGIQTTDAAGKVRASSDVILQIADAIKDKTGSEQTAIIQNIFKIRGNEAAGLQRVLNQGSAAIQEYFNVLRSTGNSFDQKQVDDVLAFGEAHRRLDLALGGVAIQLGSAFAPALAAAAAVVAHLGTAFAQTVIPALKEIPLLLPVIATGVGVLLAAAFVGAAAQAVKFTAVGLIQTGQAIGKLMAPLGALIARLAATAAAGAAAAAAQVAAWLAAAGPITLIIGGIALAAGAIALVLSGKLGEAKDAIAAGIQRIGKAVVDGWDAIQKLTQPFDIGKQQGEDLVNGINQGVTETATEKAAKAAKAASDSALKGVQDAAAGRKDAFEIGNIENNRAALEAKLDETQATQAFVPMKRQLEGLDRASLDYAHQRLVINQDELATQAKIGEEKLKNAADDLSYQEKLLLAQARAAKMRGENVDMDALRAKVLAIRTAQIQGEPDLLVAGHNAALAARAVSATSMTDQIAKDELEKRKLAIEEANQPLKDELVLRTRLAENAQKILDLNKLNFEINETYYAKDLLLAQIAAKAADEAYQKAVAAATAAGVAPSTAPLPAGVAGSGAGGTSTTANVTQTNNFYGPTDAEANLKQAAIDGTLEALIAAQRNLTGGPPARHTLPGAFAAGTP